MSGPQMKWMEGVGGDGEDEREGEEELRGERNKGGDS